MTSIPVGSDFANSQGDDDFLSVGNFSAANTYETMSKKVFSSFNVMDLEQQENQPRIQQPHSEDDSINSEEERQRPPPRNNSGLKGRRFTQQYDDRRLRQIKFVASFNEKER